MYLFWVHRLFHIQGLHCVPKPQSSGQRLESLLQEQGKGSYRFALTRGVLLICPS